MTHYFTRPTMSTHMKVHVLLYVWKSAKKLYHQSTFSCCLMGVYVHAMEDPDEEAFRLLRDMQLLSHQMPKMTAKAIIKPNTVSSIQWESIYACMLALVTASASLSLSLSLSLCLYVSWRISCLRGLDGLGGKKRKKKKNLPKTSTRHPTDANCCPHGG